MSAGEFASMSEDCGGDQICVPLQAGKVIYCDSRYLTHNLLLDHLLSFSTLKQILIRKSATGM